MAQPLGARCRLRLVPLGDGREPILFVSGAYPIRSRPARVVTGGPYAIIRHPGYLAGIVIMVASGLALDSWLATAFLAVFSLPFLLYRAVTEDRVLQAQLPGYQDYAQRVRWRLMPGVW